MSEEIPEWAKEKAFLLAKLEGVGGGIRPSDGHYYEDMKLAFARYIAGHEEAPVDSLLIEAREIVAKWWDCNPARFPGSSATDYREGKRDGCAEIEQALSALRRGIELAKSS